MQIYLDQHQEQISMLLREKEPLPARQSERLKAYYGTRHAPRRQRYPPDKSQDEKNMPRRPMTRRQEMISELAKGVF
jgi:hypothetical protein